MYNDSEPNAEHGSGETAKSKFLHSEVEQVNRVGSIAEQHG
jgi:hypothetical protein